LTPARIMIVEDERITAAHLEEVLTDLGYTVTASVASGPQAIEQAGRTNPDLILMDVHLEGDMDGIEAARRIRDRYRIPAIYLTAHADQDTLYRARDAEPLGFIVKPFQESELEAGIEMALHKDKVDREARAREQRLAATLNSVGEGVIAADREGKISFLSPMAETWTGWSRSEAIGRSVEEVFRAIGGRTRSPVENVLRRVVRDGTFGEIEPDTLLVSRHGTEQPIAGSAAPIRDHQGNLSGAVLVFGQASPEAPPSPTAVPSAPAPGAFSIVFESEAMRRLMRFVGRVAASEASTILLEGESGVGKDVIAKYLHYNGRRADGPFIAINCAAIPETLLESELFGYEKGAFTDARAQKKGTLELANGGTIFLDEISEIPLLLQAKLLRVLEEQSFRRLGGLKDLQLDLRVITATNRSLAQAVRDGRFRTDLYYRLNVIEIVVPPLRERRDDILPLARHFIRSYNQRFRRDIQGLSPEAERALVAHDWPGNVRELRNTIERAMVLEESDRLEPSSLALGGNPVQNLDPSREVPPAAALDGLSLEDAERALLIRALEKTGGNQTRAAKVLNITRDTLRYKMKKFNLTATKVIGNPADSTGPLE
jgi:PAS domain S-box-containing protein